MKTNPTSEIFLLTIFRVDPKNLYLDSRTYLKKKKKIKNVRSSNVVINILLRHIQSVIDNKSVVCYIVQLILLKRDKIMCVSSDKWNL